MTFNDFAAKKVAGVPVLYLLGGGVVILAIVAWKMKPSADSAKADEVPADASGAVEDGSDPYDQFETKGTVIVSPNPVPNPDQELANQSIQSNEEWLTKGVQFLISKNKATGTMAETALSKYLNGQDRSYNENELVDSVIAEFGRPPDGTGGTGNVGAKPAAAQFTGSGSHKVMGTTDNTASALAALYYGSSAQDRIDLIEAANVGRGAGPWAVGTQVTVPAYREPVYYTTPGSGYLSAANLAAKQGVSLDVLALLNNPKGGAYARDYLFAPKSRVRIR